MSHALSVAVVTNVRLYRDALVQTFSSNADVYVIATNGRQDWDLDSVSDIRPDVVLADAPLVCDTDLVRRIRERAPATRVIAFGVPESEAEVVACARAGACGLVLRSASSEELLEVVHAVARDELPCSPRLGALLFSALRERSERSSNVAGSLTSRETEVLALIEHGCSNKEIARRLFIEVATVKNHVHNILEKLGVSRRSAAIGAAQRRHAAGGSL